MLNTTRIAFVAAMLLSGVSVAVAAGSGKANSDTSSPGTPGNGVSTGAMPGSGMPNNRGLGGGVLNKGVSGPPSGGTSNSGEPKHSGSGPASPSVPATAQDSLSLDVRQRQTAWRDITGLALKEKAPSGFTPRVGMVVSSQLTTHPIPVSTASKVPELRPYSYALLDGNQVLIVNPNDKKIAEIITR